MFEQKSPSHKTKHLHNKHQHKLKAFLSGLVAAIFLLSISAAVQASPIEKTVTIKGISEYQLNNGLKILLAPDSSKSRTTVNMSYKVGSRNEGPGETGMAHLLEHMLFKSSPNFPDALAEFSRRGMAANGSTTTDLTNYYASFSSDAETLHWFLQWQADAMLNASISQTDLDSEMTVVRNELERGENSPFSILLQQVNAAAYVWHPYGRSVIGTISDLENIDTVKLRKFYENYYQPDNAVLIITGDFDTEQTLEWINEIFAGIKKPERTLQAEYTVEPRQEGAKDIELERSGGSPIAIAQFHIPSASNDAYTAISLDTAMLSDSPAGPLYKQLVDTKKATSVFGFARAMKKPGYALFGVQIKDKENARKILADLKSAISTKAIDELDEKALNRIKTAWLNQWQKIYNSQSSLASALSDAVANGDWRLFFIERDRIENTSLKQVKNELHSWLISNNRTSGLYLPTTKPVYTPEPKQNDLTKWIKKLPLDTDRKLTKNFDTDPASINKATELSTIKLDGGTLKIALLPKPASGKEVFANMRIHYGSAKDLRGSGYISQVTAAMLNKGTATLSRQDIKDKLNELDSELYFGGNNNVLQISMRSTDENFKKLLELCFDILKEPSFPADELDKIKSSILTGIEDQESNPAWLVSNAIERNQQPWTQDDVRYTPNIDESKELAKQININSVKDFYNEFYGTGYISFAAVGEFEPEQTRSQLQKFINNWSKTAPAYKRIDQPWYEITPKTFDIDAPGKANANYLASLPIQIQDTDPDWLALFLANYLIGGSEDSLLWREIRSRHGLSYSVGSSIQSSPWEANASWSIFASMAPVNTQKLIDGINQTLTTAIEKGFTQEEVDKGVKSLLNFLKLGRSSDSNLASRWLRYLDLDRDFSWDTKTVKKLQQLKASEVNVAMKKYLQVKGLSTAVAFDHSKKK